MHGADLSTAAIMDIPANEVLRRELRPKRRLVHTVNFAHGEIGGRCVGTGGGVRGKIGTSADVISTGG